MGNTEWKKAAFAALGEFLGTMVPDWENVYVSDFPKEWREYFRLSVDKAIASNPWFTKESVGMSVRALALMLMKKDVEAWFNAYPSLSAPSADPKRVGIVMAGNLPMVGFHDLICLLAGPHRGLIKLSSRDKILLPALYEILCRIAPSFRGQLDFPEGKLEGIDAVIATGSDNSGRYFEYYFRHIPRILRHNRNGVAVLTGGETKTELRQLGNDIFSYFGLGCRNVSRLFLPQGYDLTDLLPHFEAYRELINHNKYYNNYEYYKAIYLVNRDSHLDTGFLLLKTGEDRYSSPVSVIYYDEYRSLELLGQKLAADAARIQCVVASDGLLPGSIPFGRTQYPGLADYADGVDVVEFLMRL